MLSLALTLWQWLVARRFLLHPRLRSEGGHTGRLWNSASGLPSTLRSIAHEKDPDFGASSTNEASAQSVAATEDGSDVGIRPSDFPPLPAVTLLKPLKGCDAEARACLRSWLAQDYTGQVQVLFGVAAAEDPVCAVVRQLLREQPALTAQLIVCGPLTGTNAKVSKLLELERLAKHDVLVISDADVRVPPDFLSNIVGQLDEPEVGLVNCFYRLANPTTLAMRLEAVAINADFWSQVLQAQALKPLDFALGAVMALRRKHLEEIGGFEALKDCLADDYQLGNRLARRGHRIALSPVVVECWSEPMDWSEVWKHQLRWARTIRVCQPAPYFFSVLSNATVWPLLWLLANPFKPVLAFAISCLAVRVLSALDLQQRLTQSRSHTAYWWLAPIKDLLQAIIWLLAFCGNRIEWRGQRLRLRKDGTLVRGA
jgi:ceramide glucosyltransferase